jgi:tRNA threonylcarbamoyladenosine biosynthesis protein TsaE
VRHDVHACDVTTRSATGTRGLARRLADVCEAGDVVMLTGDLGAGKTTFVQGLAQGLGIDEVVVSPTFVLAREYRGRLALVHVDVYRIDTLAEFDDLGVFETAGPDTVVVVEWGDAVAVRLPADRLEVTIARPPGPAAGDDTRSIRIEGFGCSWTRREAALAGRIVKGAGVGEV